MSYSLTDRTLALAGIYQATFLVQEIANTGQASEADMSTCIHSIFQVDVDKAEDAFGGVEKLRTGLRVLLEQLGGGAGDTPGKNLYLTKYVAGVMVLEKRLKQDATMLSRVADGIDTARAQVEHFSLLHDNVIASLAETYAQTLSTIKPRILVQGEHLHLSNPNNANRIRALLLAAIRAAVLWRQCGGTRWQLLFQRRAIISEAQRLLA
ncbi:MAG TPA: lysogenization regulator HflD [Gammaproteobacteria bacterium]|nr:lysogenization regulator HflD [Gammaproteobacteria bacterium]